MSQMSYETVPVDLPKTASPASTPRQLHDFFMHGGDRLSQHLAAISRTTRPQLSNFDDRWKHTYSYIEPYHYEVHCDFSDQIRQLIPAEWYGYPVVVKSMPTCKHCGSSLS